MTLSSEELGGRIAAARRAANLTQEDLAEKLRINRSAMTKIERGSRKVDSLELLAISEATESPVEALLEREQSLAGLLRSQGASSNPQIGEQLNWVCEFMAGYNLLREIASDAEHVDSPLDDVEHS